MPGLICAALGMVALSLEGFGTLQNATLLLTMQRIPKAEYGLGSTLWNLAFDAGIGTGAFFFCAALLVGALGLISGTGEGEPS